MSISKQIRYNDLIDRHGTVVTVYHLDDPEISLLDKNGFKPFFVSFVPSKPSNQKGEDFEDNIQNLLQSIKELNNVEYVASTDPCELIVRVSDTQQVTEAVDQYMRARGTEVELIQGPPFPSKYDANEIENMLIVDASGN